MMWHSPYSTLLMKSILLKSEKHFSSASLMCFFRNSIFLSLFIVLFLGLPTRANAQVIALKTNLLYDASASAGLAFEAKVAPRWTLGAGVGLNLWSPVKSSDPDLDFPPKWRHVLVNAEAKYWFCQVFARDFIGVNVAYSHFNIAGGGYPIGWLYKDLENKRKQGDLVAAGVFYGWSWILSPHISIEAEAGVDVGYAWYNEFDCARCGPLLGPKNEWFVAPKLGLNFIWQIK